MEESAKFSSTVLKIVICELTMLSVNIYYQLDIENKTIILDSLRVTFKNKKPIYEEKAAEFIKKENLTKFLIDSALNTLNRKN